MLELIRDQKNRSSDVFQVLLRNFGKEERAQREHTARILLDTARIQTPFCGSTCHAQESFKFRGHIIPSLQDALADTQ